MALIVKVGRDEDVPKDAVRLTQEQALAYQMNLIRDWPKLSDVYVVRLKDISGNSELFHDFCFRFTLRMGPGLLGGAATISSLIINNHFRYKLKLGAYGRMSSYLSVVATPVLISALFHATVSVHLCKEFLIIIHVLIIFSSFSLTLCFERMTAHCACRQEPQYFKLVPRSRILSY